MTHVLVGFSSSQLADLDRLLPPRTLVIVDEPELIESRRVRERAAPFECVAEVVGAPTQDEDNAADLADLVPRPPDLRAVLPGVEYGVVGAAALARAWQVPGAGLSAARILRDKAELRRAADRAGLPQPSWRVCDGPAEAARFRAGLETGECVLKPASLQASLGVQVLDAGDDLETAWRLATGAAEPFMRASRYAATGRYLVEARVRGPEVSVEALVCEGEIVFFNITAKRVQPGRHPVETGHTVPARVSARVHAALGDHMRGLIAAVGFRSGVLHAEWILADDTRPHLVECAGRLPGDGIVSLIDLAYGGDLIADLLHVLEGRGVPAPRQEARGAAAVRFISSPTGVVRSVDGVDAARACEGVHSVDVSAAEGAELAATTSSWNRAGEVVATGPTASAAARNAEHAAALISITTTDGGA
jgi:biotin carboxylase